MATVSVARDAGVNLAEAGDFRLGPAEVRPSALKIHIGGDTQIVEPRVMQMLVALHDAAGATLTKQQLIEGCWAGLAVSDDAITQCVSKLRKALARVDGVSVESVPRVGYRLHVVQPDETAGAARGVARRPVLIGAASAATALIGAGAWWSLGSGIAGRGESIAVLPFANLSPDPGESYFSDGIAEEIRNALSRLPRLKVVGRTSSEALRDTDAASAARKLHVSSVLIGSVRRSPTLVRVAAQLIDGRTGFELWSQSYDLAPADALELQREIAESVALALRMKLGRSDHAALAAGGTANPIANDLYLRAKLDFRLSDTEATFRRVIAQCDAALGLDPRYAEAHGLKGTAWDAIGSSFASDPSATQQAYAHGAESGRAAIALAPDIPDGYVALARSLSGRLNVRGALELYRRAEPLARTDPGIVCWWIQTLGEIGKTEEALALSDKLIRLDPLNPAIFARQAFAWFFARKYEDAIRSARQALALAPGLTEQVSVIGDCLCLLGKYAEASSQYAKAPALDPYRLSGEGFVAARTGDREGFKRIVERVKRSFGDTMSFQLAQLHAQGGELDDAFAALERGRQVLDPGLNGLPADPFVDPLRRDPRFGALLKQLDFP